jgi:hypothetical protein
LVEKRNVETWHGRDYGPVTSVSRCNPGLGRGVGGGVHVGGVGGGAGMHVGGVGGGAGMRVGGVGGGAGLHIGGVGGAGTHIGGVGGGVGTHIGGIGGGAGMHIGDVGGGTGAHNNGVGGGAGTHVGDVGGAQASIDDGRVDSVSGRNSTGRTGGGDGQSAQGGYRGDHDRHHGHGPEFGLGAGLAAGSALSYGSGGYDPYNYLGYYDPDYSSNSYGYGDPDYDGYSGSVVASGAESSYCAQRYKSYDPASGTYLGRDGLRHPCP